MALNLNSLSKSFSKLSIYSLLLAVGLMPFQLILPIYGENLLSIESNNFITIWLSVIDVLFLISAFSALAFNKIKIERSMQDYLSVGLIFLSFAGLSLLFTPSIDAQFESYLIAKLCIYTAAIYSFAKNAKYAKVIKKVFIASVFFQALIAILQFTMQSSVGLHILGEPHLDHLGIANFSLHELKLIRSYGASAHPNLLAAFLAAAMILSFSMDQLNVRWRKWIALILTLGLIASFSRSAFLALFVTALFAKINKKGVLILAGFILLAVFAIRGFELNINELERLTGMQNAIEIWKDFPLGVGWQKSLFFLDWVRPNSLDFWQYQPVHNSYLLLLTELGALAFLSLIFVLKQLYSGISKGMALNLFILISALALFDHYFISLEQGRQLLILSSFFIFQGYKGEPFIKQMIKTFAKLRST